MYKTLECPGCLTEIPETDISEMTTLEDHGVCYQCHKEILMGYRCAVCYSPNHTVDNCPHILEEA